MDRELLVNNFLDSEKRLKLFPAKRKMKAYALGYLAGKFETEKRYTEKEVNELLMKWHTFGDAATLRRELYDYHFLNREPNGSIYWLEENQPVFDN